ncbi:MAG: dUTP diphosphatase [Bacteriovoracaceae bacterium]|nr:dUTP diphosphatase [Bacteriovoracaceae bacterium]
MVQIKVVKLDHFDSDLQVPSYETTGSAGADVRACLGAGKSLVIKPFSRVLVPTGLTFEIPFGFEVQVRPRSGLSFKTGLMVVNSPGTIDSDYRGEIKVIIGNLGNKEEIIEHGDRIAQLIVSPIIQANFLISDSLSSTSRGAGGFGSTGK